MRRIRVRIILAENENSIEFLKGRGEFTIALARFAERKLNYSGLEERAARVLKI